MNINLFDVYSEAWHDTLKKGYGVLGVNIIIFLLFFAFWIFAGMMWWTDDESRTSFLFQIPWIISSVFLIHQTLKIYNNSVKLSLEKFLYVLVAAFLVGFLTILWFIFFILPGIYIAVKLSYTFYAIIDEDLWPIEAMKRSWEITNDNWWLVFANKILGSIIIVAGILLPLFLIYLLPILWIIIFFAVVLFFASYVLVAESNLYFKLK